MNISLLLRGGTVLIGSLIVSFFSGCATAIRVPLSGAEKQVTSSQVVVGLRSQEIATDIHPSNVSAVTGGGLIGAIVDTSIDHSRAKDAEKAVIPLRNALVGYDLGQDFSDALRAELAKIDWLKNVSVDTRHLPNNKALTAWVKDANTDVVLVADTDYRLTPDFDAITLRVVVSLHAHAPALAKNAIEKDYLPPVLYFNVFATTIPLPVAIAKGKLDECATFWAADGGKLAREALGQAIPELAKMLAFDLQQPGTQDNALYKAPPGADKWAVLVPATPGVPQQLMMEGYVVHQEGSRVWVRLPGGQLVSTKR